MNEIKEQIDNLYADPCFMELIENLEEAGDLQSLAESYYNQESPFAIMEVEE